ncbi:MAG: hypothetical protein ACNA8W_04060 [Bradymonadaceae bacterium]
MTSSPISWIVRVDRRKAPREDIVEELKSLAASIQALGLEIVADEAFWDAPGRREFSGLRAPGADLSPERRGPRGRRRGAAFDLRVAR